MRRAGSLVEQYQKEGFADGTRTKHRQAVFYAVDTWPDAHVWGGPEHIRVWFGRNPHAQEPTDA